MLDSPDLTIEYDPKPQDIEFLDERLYDFNRTQIGKNGGKFFAIYQRSLEGEIFAGLYGWIWAQACKIEMLWVHPNLRGQGYGRRLMEMAEQEAMKRGCQVITLDTHSFQAPEFYPKLGYQIVACLDDFPPGHQTYYFVKRLGLANENKP